MDQIRYTLEKANLEALGYRPGASAIVNATHERYAAAMNCRRCKAHGLRCEIWSNGTLTAVFAICSACGYVVEI
jgi:hypothetical protein